jgi:ABC-type microcin C transport system permease subunit YejE
MSNGARSESILRKRVRKFRRIKRGYYSFLIITAAYAFSFFLPLVMSGTPLAVKYRGQYFSPMLRFHSVTDFGIEGFGEPDYRALKRHFEEAGTGDWVMMPPSRTAQTVPPGLSGRRPTRHRGSIHLAPTTEGATFSRGLRTASTSR